MYDIQYKQIELKSHIVIQNNELRLTFNANAHKDSFLKKKHFFTSQINMYSSSFLHTYTEENIMLKKIIYTTIVSYIELMCAFLYNRLLQGDSFLIYSISYKHFMYNLKFTKINLYATPSV